MNILVIGSGGREHALGWTLAKSPNAKNIFFGPGNGGTTLIGKNIFSVKPLDFKSLDSAIYANDINFAICGPEEPLVMGIYEYIQNIGIDCIGPGAIGARLEGSKIFAKEFQFNMGIPSAKYLSFTNPQHAIDHINAIDYQPVIKCDGLAAGKGVLLPKDKPEARKVIEDMMISKKFKEASEKIIIEERLDGFETTLLAFVDGETILPMLFSQDYKRAFDNNKGLNTGGMGCLCPHPAIDKDLEEEIIDKIVNPTTRGFKEFSIPYKGILYFGLMITKDGPYILEYNVRMGDPEAQVVLPLLKTDLTVPLKAINDGTLKDVTLEWHDKTCVGVILASEGYPEEYQKGVSVNGLMEWDEPKDDFILFHAGTKRENNYLNTSGGRVVCMTALGDSLADCREKLYSQISQVNTEGLFYRTDIAAEYIK